MAELDAIVCRSAEMKIIINKTVFESTTNALAFMFKRCSSAPRWPHIKTQSIVLILLIQTVSPCPGNLFRPFKTILFPTFFQILKALNI